MSSAHMAVAVLGMLSLAESIWGLAAPRAVQQMMQRVLEESPRQNPAMGSFFLVLACVLWFFLSPEQRLADYVLVLYSWLLVGGGLLSFQPHGIRNVMELFLIRRQPSTVRLLYATEFAWAIAILYVAGRGL